MKFIIIASLIFSAAASQASQYNCVYSNGTANDPKAIPYSIDTALEENKMVDLGQGTAVGCVVFRSTPQLLSCGVGQGENFSIFTVVEDGSSVVSLQTNSHGSKTLLSCVKTK